MRTSNQIRQEYIEFFRARGHAFVPSSPLLPADDPTLLFANAGMNQFKDVFLGTSRREYTRAVNTQKCIRAGGKHNDLEDVGHDTYHHTFFEMLGNWSFGDYFKAEAIQWAWQLLTEVWGMPAERIWVTVFGGDEAEGLQADYEARDFWLSKTNIEPSHVHEGGKKDNFWEMGETGPCGPCSEIHIDLTDDLSGGKLVNAGDERVIEIWNLVFMQFNRGADGKLSPLPACHVDTGMGFERICFVLQGKRSNYATDLFVPIIKKIETLTGHRYGEYVSQKVGRADRFDITGQDDIADVACRVVADHARALTFAIADGVIPSNEGRGYVLRRILRRAARYGRQYLKIDGPFLVKLIPTIVQLMGEAFPEIAVRQKQVERIILEEEQAFGRTLDRGIKKWWDFARAAFAVRVRQGHSGLDVQYIGEVDPGYSPNSQRAFINPEDVQCIIKEGQREVDKFTLTDLSPRLTKEYCKQAPEVTGEAAFELYATYGFPVDLTVLMAKERGISVDLRGFEQAMQAHRETSSTGVDKFKMLSITGLPATDDSFKFDPQDIDAKVLGWVIGDKYINEGKLSKGVESAVVLDRTNFYGEQGGQVGDTGELSWPGGRFEVHDTRLAGQCVLHVGQVVEGELEPGLAVQTRVCQARLDTMRNHTATHLLNWALREVLGDQVNQAGSVVGPDRLRFDFTHSQATTSEQLEQVERLVNRRIQADQQVTVKLMPLAETRKIPGVRAVFGERYPDPVRVVCIGGQEQADAGERGCSVEFCGGTHLDRTGRIGFFKIVGEESVAKGVRRITALTAGPAVEYVQRFARWLSDASRILRTAPDELSARIEAMQKELKDLRKRPQGGPADRDIDICNIVKSRYGDIIIAKVDDQAPAAMRSQCDRQRQKGAAGVFLGATDGQKVTLVAMVSDELVDGGALKAGDWVREVAPLIGGSGGGKPTLAQAGGKDAEKLDLALTAAAEYARRFLG